MRRRRRETPTVPAELIALPPVAFALWLVAGAPNGLAHWPARDRAGVVIGAAVVLGPLALALLGLFGWLLLMVVVTAALTGFATARRADRLPRHGDRGSRRVAVPEP